MSYIKITILGSWNGPLRYVEIILVVDHILRERSETLGTLSNEQGDLTYAQTESVIPPAILGNTPNTFDPNSK